jgi:hypothetical protein
MFVLKRLATLYLNHTFVASKPNKNTASKNNHYLENLYNTLIEMKSYTIFLIFLFINAAPSVAQDKYDYRLYNGLQRTETGQIKTICPCEAAKFFSSREDIIGRHPVIISQNCPQYTLAFSDNRSASEGFSLSDFFRRFKRKRKVTYPKGSHIIPLLQN